MYQFGILGMILDAQGDGVRLSKPSAMPLRNATVSSGDASVPLLQKTPSSSNWRLCGSGKRCHDLEGFCGTCAQRFEGVIYGLYFGMQRLWSRSVGLVLFRSTRSATADATWCWRDKLRQRVEQVPSSLKDIGSTRRCSGLATWSRCAWQQKYKVAGTRASVSTATKASGSSASPPRASAAVETAHSDELGLPARGAPPGAMPTAEDQAIGLERLELEHPDIFKHNEVIRGPFGTLDAPVLVESAYDSRIVGCTGPAAPHDHDLYWIEVRKDRPAVCPLCEQVFALKPAA